MSECRCVTGGLHVDGTCLVCYRAVPGENVATLDPPDLLTSEDGTEWMVPISARMSTPWAAVREAISHMGRLEVLPLQKLERRWMRPAEDDDHVAAWCEDMWIFCDADHPRAFPFWHGCG